MLQLQRSRIKQSLEVKCGKVFIKEMAFQTSGVGWEDLYILPEQIQGHVKEQGLLKSRAGIGGVWMHIDTALTCLREEGEIKLSGASCTSHT